MRETEGNSSISLLSGYALPAADSLVAVRTLSAKKPTTETMTDTMYGKSNYSSVRRCPSLPSVWPDRPFLGHVARTQRGPDLRLRLLRIQSHPSNVSLFIQFWPALGQIKRPDSGNAVSLIQIISEQICGYAAN